MKTLKAILPLTFAIILILAGNRVFKVSGNSLPPLMSFLNPFSGFWTNADSADKVDESILLDGLSESIEIIFDDRMVPHIFAQNDGDAIFAQGYLHAKYRLFQMDLSNRATGGRLAEVLGPRLLENDRKQRFLGIQQSVKKTLQAWSAYPETIALLDKYTDGVNAYINELSPKDYPVEYKLINFAPEPWTNSKTVLMLKTMTMMLAGGNLDIQNSNLVRLLGKQQFDDLYPDWNPLQSPIIADDEVQMIDFAAQEAQPFEPSHSYPKSPFKKYPEFIGSNNWVISGDKTQIGHPILCNDPHLGLTLPSIWYEMHVHTPEVNVYGVGIPGIPSVIIGFNEDVAWGTTNVGHDLWDWYEMDWTDEQRTSYRYEGKVLDVTTEIETIKVKGQAEVNDTIKYTVHGPVVPEYAGNKGQRSLSFRWIGNEEPDLPEINTFINLNKAKNYADFKQSIESYIAPSQNFVFADRSGDIALHVIGKLPIRQKEGGKFIKDGAVSDPDWQAFIPRSELPHSYNPERGFAASANQHSAGQSYPYHYIGSFEDYRGRRINDYLASKDDLTRADLSALQMDNYSVLAEDLLPILLRNVTKSEDNQTVLNSLSNWDMVYDAETIAPSYFEIWADELYDLVFEEIEALSEKESVRFPEWWRMIDLLKNQNEHPIFDYQETTTVVEHGDQLIAMALDSAVIKINRKNDDDESLAWSDYQQRDILHLSRIPAFSEMNIASSGSGDTPNANWGTHGPSWRMIVELHPEGIKAFGVYPGGQDGNPGSEHYKTGLSKWLTGEYFELFFPKSKADAKAKQAKLLKLTPKNS